MVPEAKAQRKRVLKALGAMWVNRMAGVDGGKEL
jgi:hypothetical protein